MLRAGWLMACGWVVGLVHEALDCHAKALLSLCVAGDSGDGFWSWTCPLGLILKAPSAEVLATVLAMCAGLPEDITGVIDTQDGDIWDVLVDPDAGWLCYLRLVFIVPPLSCALSACTSATPRLLLLGLPCRV